MIIDEIKMCQEYLLHNSTLPPVSRRPPRRYPSAGADPALHPLFGNANASSNRGNGLIRYPY